MPALKPDHIFVTDEEDAAITAAALGDPDALPLTDAELSGFRPAREVFSSELMARLTDKSKPVVIRHVTDAEHAERVEAIRRRGRPKLAAPKEKINVRLSPDVLAHLRATGRGWQTRIDEVLREAVEAGRL